MSYVVKAERAADSSKPPAYYAINEEEVTLKDRAIRSSNPDEYYHLSPDAIARASNDILPLDYKVVHTLLTPPSHSNTAVSTPSPSSWESDGDFIDRINLHDTPITTAEVYNLGATVDSDSASSATIVVSDVNASLPTVPSAPLYSFSPTTVKPPSVVFVDEAATTRLSPPEINVVVTHPLSRYPTAPAAGGLIVAPAVSYTHLTLPTIYSV